MLLCAGLFLTACAKAIPPEALTNVDHAISFKDLNKNPEAFTGKTILLGGTIVLTENEPKKTTLIILQHDLDSDFKPINNDDSEGRFMVTVPEFLDPAIFAEGRRITAVGTVTGRETRPLNGIPYVYPVIEKTYLHLWPHEYVVDSKPRVYLGIGIGIGNYGF
jgi:outer membrane lipoprotein